VLTQVRQRPMVIEARREPAEADASDSTAP